MYSYFYPFLVATLLLFGCADSDDSFKERPAESLYKEAQGLLKEEEYTKAATLFAEVERQHPYSNLASKSQFMSSVAYYRARKYADAVDNFKTFIALHPANKDVPEALYRMGVCYYEQVPIFERDQRVAVEAYQAFKEVIVRFPESPFAKDARFKLDILNNQLAAKEMSVGRFYQTRKNYIAAMGRFKEVIETYQTTEQTPEALYRIVECSLALSLDEEALKAAKTLGHNYRCNTWYKKAYELIQNKKAFSKR